MKKETPGGTHESLSIAIAYIVLLALFSLTVLSWYYVQKKEPDFSPYVLWGGTAVSVLFFWVLFLLITARKRELIFAERMNKELKSSEQFLQGTLDSLSAHIAILDEKGVILSVNRAWKKFAEENNLQDPAFAVGSNYLKTCESAVGINDESAKEVAKGIRLVLAHQNYEFNQEYSCHSLKELRWFVVRITRFESGKNIRLVVAHENITNRKLAEETLKQSEEHFRALIENSLDVVTILSADGIIRFQSAAVKRVLGYEPEELLGKSAFDLVHPEDQGKVINAIAKAIENPGYASTLIFRFMHKDGSWRVLQGAGKNLLNDPIVRGMVINSMDITERRTEEEARFQLANIVENSDDAIFSETLDGMVTSWNRGAEKIYGYSAREMINEPISKIIPEGRKAELHEITEKMRKGESIIHFETVRVRKDRKMINVSLSVSPIRNESGTVIGKSVIARDITEDKRKNDELREARDAALDATKAKSDFLATMSHEIRTPMNAIIGMADLLEETSLNPEQQEYVRIFKRAGDTLLNLINDILDLGKVESGNLELEDVTFDLQDMLERTVELMAIRAHEKGLELSCRIAQDVSKELIGDPHRLRQIVINLVGNAIKFTEKGEVAIEVKNARASASPEGKRRLIFSIRDTGIGISRNKIFSIFEAFVQADSSTTRKYGGSGLGLSITKRLVELMGGQIWVESHEEGGSTFFFEIPFEIPRKAEVLEDAPQRTVSLKNMKVLIVDDNATNRLILKEYISSLGAEANEASNAEDGLRELKNAKEMRKPYQLMLLDCRMPGENGFQMAEKIKDDPGLADIIIMMLTSESRYGDIAQSRKLGLSGYIVKPIKRGELINAILTCLNRVQSKAEMSPSINLDAFVRPLNILFAEDSLDNRLLVKAYLKNYPFELENAVNGEEALEKFKNNNYDIVLMDIQMPVMDGYAATQKIRKWESEHGLKTTPVVALTAHAFKEDAQKCLEAGFTAYITKPVKKIKLLEVISNLTNHPEVRKEAA